MPLRDHGRSESEVHIKNKLSREWYDEQMENRKSTPAMVSQSIENLYQIFIDLDTLQIIMARIQLDVSFR